MNKRKWRALYRRYLFSYNFETIDQIDHRWVHQP